jgi:hypothetical protein
VQSYFLKKGLKIKFEKWVPVVKNWKNGYLPPVDWAGGMGPGTSRPSSGRDVPKIFPGPSQEPLKKFLIREELPEAGIPPGQWAGGAPAYFFCYILLEFMVYKPFEIQNFFKYNIYSPYSFVYI